VLSSSSCVVGSVADIAITLSTSVCVAVGMVKPSIIRLVYEVTVLVTRCRFRVADTIALASPAPVIKLATLA